MHRGELGTVSLNSKLQAMLNPGVGRGGEPVDETALSLEGSTDMEDVRARARVWI